MNSNKLFIANGITARREFFGALVFNQQNSRILEINKVGALVLKQIAEGNDPYQKLKDHFPNLDSEIIKRDVDSFIKYLRDNKVVSDNSFSKGRFVEKTWETDGKCLAAPRSIFWECIDVCNIATCIHCYSHSDDYLCTLNDGYALIQQMAELGVFVIDIGGGEPLLRKDLPDLINFANSNGIRCNIATNFSLPKEQVIRFVESVNNWTYNSLQISLDGHCAELHDKIRGSQGWFQKTISNIEILRISNIRYRINCTIMKLNIAYVEEIVEKAIALQASAVRFIRIIPSGRGKDSNLQISAEEYKKHCLKLVELRKKYKSFIDVGIDDSFLFLELTKEEYKKIKPRIPWIQPPHVGCGAARTLMAITANNYVLPCSYLNHPKFISGNINQDTIESIWKKSTIFQELREQKSLGRVCDICSFKDKCLGGCRAAIFGTYNTIEEKDPLCWK